ncbi:hypothetical protein K5D56_21670 [Pseudomonas cichorii]|nr:hypothetical protein [Pseudomonas cichorii]MBX8557077.1 hypothetical protein [Pseudomonas cichorii]MBX8591978.1 hypothetical protein [Pseudomonas cichorii]
MRKIKISPSQLICLALTIIGLALALCRGRSYLEILIPISVGIFMPFYSLAYTGCFTYLPKAKKVDHPTKTKQAPQLIKISDKPRLTANTPPEYDLRDIPYPPKRKGSQPTSSLPYGTGLGPEKTGKKTVLPRCALLEKKSVNQSDTQTPETPIGKTIPLVTNTEPMTTHDGEDVFVQQDSIFL